MRRKFDDVWTCVSRDMRGTDKQDTDTQTYTDRHTHCNTVLSARLPLAEQ